MNKQSRSEIIKTAALQLCGAADTKTFIKGAKWADKNPAWIENSIPQPQLNPKNGLPKLYLCKILSLSMDYGYSYTYRIGFVTADNRWNIEKASNMMKVLAYMDICSNDTDEDLMKDIKANEDYFVSSTIESLKKSEH